MAPVQAERDTRIEAVTSELSKLRVKVGVGADGPQISTDEVRRLAQAAVDAVIAADSAATQRRADERRERGEQMRRDIDEGRAISK